MKIALLIICSCLFGGTMLRAQTTQIWGTTSYGGACVDGTIFSMQTDGSEFTTEYTFCPVFPNGTVPMGNLLFANDGNLYGTCLDGGDQNSCTIFQFNPFNGDYADVYSFDVIHG